jgi:hypothetical protein
MRPGSKHAISPSDSGEAPLGGEEESRLSTSELDARTPEAKAKHADEKSAIDSLKESITEELISQLTNEQKAKLLHDALREAGSASKLGEVLRGITNIFTLSAVESLLEVFDKDKGADFEIQKQLMPFAIAKLSPGTLLSESWREATFDFLRGLDLEMQKGHLHRFETEVGSYSSEAIEFIASELPGIPTTFEGCARWNVVDRITPEEAKRIILGRNTVDIVLLCMEQGDAGTDTLGKIVEKLEPADVEAFARALTHCHSEIGKRIANSLFAEGMPQKLTKEKFEAIAGEPVAAHEPPAFHGTVKRLVGASKRGALDDEIRALQTELKAVVGEACKCLASKPTVFTSMEVRQRIANEIAVCCFDDSGQIDIESVFKLGIAIQRMVAKNELPDEWPNARQMCSQMIRILGYLMHEKSDLRDRLSQENSEPCESGRKILETISAGRASTLTPKEATLAALLVPHEQLLLPTCSINSLINTQTFNDPGELAAIYLRMLELNAAPLPSGRFVHQCEIGADGTVAVDLSQGGRVRDSVFEKYDERRKLLWKSYGVEYDGSEPDKLKLRIRNLTDVFFANFFQTTFGDSRINGNREYGVLFAYLGTAFGENADIYSPGILLQQLTFEDSLDVLKAYAWQQKEQGLHYMRVKTSNTSSTHAGHAENLDIDAILGLELEKMKDDVWAAVGNRNWILPDLAGVPMVLSNDEGKAVFCDGCLQNDGSVCGIMDKLSWVQWGHQVKSFAILRPIVRST